MLGCIAPAIGPIAGIVPACDTTDGIVPSRVATDGIVPPRVASDGIAPPSGSKSCHHVAAPSSAGSAAPGSLATLPSADAAIAVQK